MRDDIGNLKHIVSFKIKVGKYLRQRDMKKEYFYGELKNLTGKDPYLNKDFYKNHEDRAKVRYTERVGMWGIKESYSDVVTDNLFRSNNTDDLVELLFELIEILNNN